MAARTFTGERDVAAAAAAWERALAQRPVAAVVDWLVGAAPPPAAVRAEVEAHLAALLADARTAGVLPAGAGVVSGLRSFAAQLAIWRRKLAFDGAPFDRISDHARATCGAALDPPAGLWRPDVAAHRRCWGVEPWQAAADMGVRALTLAERQREILLASAAPGLSRHHWGTEVDLVTVDAAAWSDDGPLAALHAWLRDGGAARRGFGRPFGSDSGGYGRGPEEERWHLSYLPVARAQLGFADAHEPAVGARLAALWKGRPELSVPAAEWRTLLFAVDACALP